MRHVRRRVGGEDRACEEQGSSLVDGVSDPEVDGSKRGKSRGESKHQAIF